MSAVKVKGWPATTGIVEVEAPRRPPTLQRRSVEVRSVTGEL